MITSAECKAIAEQSARHLLGLIQPNGKYVYAHPLNDPGSPLRGYNYLRHCGTTWYLCTAVQELGLRLSAAEQGKLTAAVRFITDRLAEPTWQEGFLPRLCLPEKGAVKLGGNGLALLMLHEYAALDDRLGAKPRDASADPATIARLENYILSQAQSDDFLHKRFIDDGTIATFRSDYYTGEALFGLARGGRFTPAVIQIFSSLMARDYGLDVQSHWMCYAACEAFDRRLMKSAELGPYIVRLVKAIVEDTAYRDRHQSTPIACRSEALARFLVMERGSAVTGFAFDPALVAAAKAAVEENLALQAKWYAAGQFQKGNGDDRVQIDYIQHNAMAFLAWGLLIG